MTITPQQPSTLPAMMAAVSTRRRYKSLPAFLLLFGLVSLSLPGSADEAASEGEKTVVARRRLHWTYPRFHWLEAIASAAATGGQLALESTANGFRDGAWGGILFDSPLRNALVAKSLKGRRQAANISDILWPLTQQFPVIDALLTPILSDECNFDVALQMTLINWQVLGVTGLFTRAAQHIAGRSRPSLQECAANPHYSGSCDPDSVGRTASFISGHTSMSFAAAGLTCAHHQALPLYGGNAADAAICALTVATATTTGVLRIVADRHWPTDVMLGALLGTATGYGLPRLLHYHQPAHVRVKELNAQLTLVPYASDSRAGAAFIGVF